MKKTDQIKRNIKIFLLSMLTVVLLCITIVFTVMGIYSMTENNAREQLHLRTQQVKRDINLQIYSDRENLMTMASFAAELHASEADYSLLFKSFEEIGLFENIGIFLPDNTLVTKAGKTNITKLSFYEEKKKGAHITGRVEDLTVPNKEVVRAAIPVITKDGETVAILYGIINLDTFKERYKQDARDIGAEVYVVDGKTGEFILDTKNETLGNFSRLSATKFKEGFSYSSLAADLAAGRDGFSNFYSVNTQEDVYAHYSPLEVANWQIILTQPEELVFAGARTNIGYVTAMASIIFLIMILYIIIIINSERKNVKISTFASNIRKTLLEVNRDSSKVSKALESVATFAKSRSAFFVDSYSEDYNYIIPSKTKKLLKGEDRKFFISQMFNYISKQRKKRGADIQFIMIKPDLKLRSNMPDFCKFLKENDIKSISIVAIFSNSSNLNVLGVINAKDKQVEILLKDIAICFSIAIYNKKHLLKTESMAITDALTGVANRMAYNRDIKIISERKNNQLTCIYIDVNELNYFNNTYGHAAGDQLLIFVAETLMNEFSDSMIYRMGGDEFLIFTENISKDEILERLTRANHVIEEMKYHVSIGVKSSADDLSIEDIVSEAEKRMYEEKARYYQKSELSKETKLSDNNIRFIKTGIKEVDESLAIMRERYRGVYFVSLTEDKAVQVLAPANYFVVSGEENKFSDILKEYIHDAVKPEFHRTLLNFMQYDVISKQLKNGHVPKLSYTKKDGVKIVLSVHKTVNEADDHTIWMFEAVDE